MVFEVRKRQKLERNSCEIREGGVNRIYEDTKPS